MRNVRGRIGAWIPWTALAATLGVIALLLWQAEAAERAHRETARRVAREAAASATATLLGRVRSQLEYYGVLPALAIYRQAATDSATDPPPSVSELVPDVDDRGRQALQLVAGAVRLGAAGLVASPEIDPELAARVGLLARSALDESPPQEREVLVVEIEPSLRLALTAGPEAETWIGILVSTSSYRPYLERALGGRPLLPSLEGEARAKNEVRLVLRDPSGREIFATEERPAPGSPRFEVGPHLGEMLAGLEVECALGPADRARLLAEGVPPTRRPLLVALAAVSALLALAALVQIARERAFARLRSDFVAGVSHELRTPLAQIRIFAETLLLDRVRSEAERRRALEVIDRESRRLVHLVDNVLRVSRSGRGEAPPLASERLDLRATVRETVEAFEPLAAARGVEVEVDAPESAVVLADGDALRQVLLNLLDNAVKYGPRGGRVRLELRRVDGAVTIAVEDDGPGVPPAERARIFERFYRPAASRRSEAGGSGIGLSVVRDLVEGLDGRIEVGDARRGDGARFEVRLPACADAAGMDAPDARASGEGEA